MRILRLCQRCFDLHEMAPTNGRLSVNLGLVPSAKGELASRLLVQGLKTMVE